MKRLFYLSALAFVFSIQGAKFDPFEGPQPIAVLIQSNPWAMMLGSDTPRVALYEDGTIIFVKEKQPAYHFKKLETPEILRIKNALMPVGKVATNSYALTRQHDQTEAGMYVRLDGGETAVRVYGLGRPDRKPTNRSIQVEESKIPPAEVLAAHKLLWSLDYADSLPWQPKFIEVMIWPYEYAPDRSIVWPKDWPDLNSERSEKRGDSHSIYMDGGMLAEVDKFLRTRKDRGAVEISGKKWAVSVRRVFPSEPVWSEALEKTRQ